MMLSVIS